MCAARVAWVAFLAAVASTAFAAEPAKKAAEVAVDPAAVAVVQRAGEFLRAHERFSFRAETAFEVVQDDGEKLEFGASRRYLVRRPDRVRVEVEPRSGERQLIVFDGDQLTMAQPDAKVYSQVKLKQHREIDAMLDALRDAFGVPVPIGALLRANPSPDIIGSLTSAYRVGDARIGGAECDQIAVRNEHTDVQFWIEQGDEPLLRRVVITYRDEPGAPSFAADLGDWKLDAKSSDKDFRYAPPKDAERIRFAVPAKPAAAAAPEAQ